MSDAEDRVSSGRSWAEFCDALKRAGEQIQRADAPSDPFTRAEGYRYLSRLARAGLEWYVEFNDPAFPVLYKPSHETIKIGADNPDNIYEKAVVDGRHDYRIRGKRGSVYYLSMVTSKGSYAENFKQIETGFLDSNQLQVAADGSFEIILSATPKPGNWLPMDADSQSLLIRQTFMDRASETPAEITIERADLGATPDPLTAETFDRNLATAAEFHRQHRAPVCRLGRLVPRPKPNELPPADQQLCHSVGGDPNIFYYHSYFELAEDEALVIEVERIPECLRLEPADRQLLDGVAGLPLPPHPPEQAHGEVPRRRWRHDGAGAPRPRRRQLAGYRGASARHAVLSLDRREGDRASDDAGGEARRT